MNIIIIIAIFEDNLRVWQQIDSTESVFAASFLGIDKYLGFQAILKY